MWEGNAKTQEPRIINWIPYYAWAHRGRHEMSVWLGRNEEGVFPLHSPTPASRARVSVSFGRNPEAVRDQLDPRSSIDHEVPYFHWWPNKGKTEFIQYDWEQPVAVSSVEVYWFDDEGMGECRSPKSWRLFWRAPDGWRPVETQDSYGTDKDRFNRVLFKPVTTRALRIEVDSQENWAGGIHEWRVR